MRQRWEHDHEGRRTTDAQLGGRPFYGYDAADAQRSYTNRGADEVADFPAPRLSEGMSVLDYDCGPGPITLGFALTVSLSSRR